MTLTDELEILSQVGNNCNEALKVLSFSTLYEINVLLDRINYYLEHIKVLRSSSLGLINKKDLFEKKKLLENLQNILLNELQRRDFGDSNSPKTDYITNPALTN